MVAKPSAYFLRPRYTFPQLGKLYCHPVVLPPFMILHGELSDITGTTSARRVLQTQSKGLFIRVATPSLMCSQFGRSNRQSNTFLGLLIILKTKKQSNRCCEAINLPLSCYNIKVYYLGWLLPSPELALETLVAIFVMLLATQ